MICKYGFFTCINLTMECPEMCETCEDGDNYEIDDNFDIEEDETLQ